MKPGLQSLIVAVLFAVAVSSPGATIPGLFNTGLGTNGALLGDAAIDPHYRLVQSDDPSAPGPNAVVVNANSSPIRSGPWLPNGPSSKWIAPSADQNTGNAPGRFTYRLSFDLAGLDPATAVITGRWNTDNDGVQIVLNGHNMGLSKGTDFATFSPTFTLTNFFVSGTNALDFTVLNYSQGINPTAFRAEVTGTASIETLSNTPPSILTQPASIAVGCKEPGQFSATARGTPPLLYQWRLNGIPVSGGTGATLLLGAATAANAGDYDVMVTNPFGAATSAVATLTIVVPTRQQATAEALGPSSRRTGLIFSEIMYHPTNRLDGKNLEFIELYNSNPYFEDIGAWRISGDVDYTFPAGTRIAANSFLVVAPSPEDVQTVYGISGVLGGFTNSLSNNSGLLRLRKKSGGIVLEVNYSSHHPWPVAADGTGHSMVLARATFGEGNPHAWDVSAQKGGTPGAPDFVPAAGVDNILINEVLAHTDPPLLDYIELYNPFPLPVDISGCWLSDAPTTNKFRIADGTVLNPGGHVVFDESMLGFSLAADGESVFFVNSNQTRVLDALRFDGQENGIAFGRYPDGTTDFYRLSSRTPGSANGRIKRDDVVINEIQYAPLSDDDDDQYLELYNRGSSSVDLGGWQFTSGINFTFPSNVTLVAGGYLVIARNVSRLRTNYPALSAGNLLGNFTGKLSHSGERIALSKPDVSVTLNPLTGVTSTNYFQIAVDEVTYNSGGRWGLWSHGGGSSLELRDPRSNPRLAAHWGESDESAKAPWTFIEQTGVLDLGWGNADRLQLFLLGAGEALIDDVEVLVAGVNRVANSNFETGTTSWIFQGTHSASGWENTGYNSGHSLHLRASDRGDQSANRVYCPLTSAIATGSVATIRTKVRWLKGHPEVLLRLKGNYLEASGRLNVPANLGTPGGPNSQRTTNAAPAIFEVQHAPVLPAAFQAIRVTARVDDIDDVQSVTLKYRIDPAVAVHSVPMTDDGTGNDVLAGDGIYTASIPGQAARTLVAFRIEAADAHAVPATALFPADAPARECLIRIGESQPTGSFATYRLWMTAAAQSNWATRAPMSNADLDTTFVHGTNRVIYNAGAHYSGSSSTAQGYNSPVGVLCGYSISLPADDRFLGSDQIVLDWPVRDLTDQREPLMFWFLEQLGLPNMYRRYVHLHVNGVTENERPNYPAQIGNGIFDDVQQPGGDVIDEWFSGDDEGPLHKSNCWEEFNDAGTMEPVNCIKLNSLELYSSGGAKKVARYRWNWQPRAIHHSANDFTQLLELVDAMNAPESNYLAAVDSVVDVDHWMRTFVANDLAANWDSWGNFNAKNSYIYKPSKAGWKILSFDFDVGLGVLGADTPTYPLFDPNDPTLVRMNQTPAFVRHYWCALAEALSNFFYSTSGGPLDAFLSSRYAAFQANGLPLSAPDSIKTWVNQRRSFLQSHLNTVTSPFTISGPTVFSTMQNPVVLSGTAPVTVHTLTVNGIEYTPAWSSVSNWSLMIPLGSPTNILAVEALDSHGGILYSANYVITYTGPLPTPATLRINEWMADNTGFLLDPATQRFEDWFEIFNPSTNPIDLTGFTLTDDALEPARSLVPRGVSVPAGGFLFVWADGISSTADTNLHVNFSLNKGGELIALFDPFGRLIDSVSFGPQTGNVSQGRWRDGMTNIYFMTTPTPAAANVLPNPAPSILSIVSGLDSTLTLTWTAQPGRIYTLESKNALNEPWTIVPAEVTATSSTAELTISPPSTHQMFYRVLAR